MGDEGEILSVGGLVTKMKQDNRQLGDLIKYLDGMVPFAVPARNDVLRYLRELETLRAEGPVPETGHSPSVTACIVHSKRMQGMWGDGDTKEIALSVATTKYLRELEALRAENARLREQATYYAAEARFGPANPQRNELLRVATALMATDYGIRTEQGDSVGYGENDAVKTAQRLIAAVDAACEQPAGEAKAWVEVIRGDDGFYRADDGSPFHAVEVHHGHLVPAKGE